MTEQSNWLPLVFSILILIIIVSTLVSFYGNFKSQPWYVSLVCIVGWFFPFWIVLLLPLDMASTLYEDCDVNCRRPLTYVSQSFLYVAWRTIYWTSFCLTWMFIPMMQAYVNTGEFQAVRRLISAAKVNFRFYMIYVVIGILGLFYLVFKGGITTRMKLQGFVMAMANSWGLFLVIMLMGYGLVAVPRKLWYASNSQHHLNELYKKASRIKEECMDSELEFNELAKTINTISHRPIRSDPNLRLMVDNTVKRFPFVKHPIYADRDHSSGIPQVLTEEYIITLNRNMILAARMKDRKSALWQNLLSEAYYLQDIETNKGNLDRRFHSNLRPLQEVTFWTDMKTRIEWWWVIMFRSIIYRGLSVILGVASICILWSELVFNIKSPLISIVGLTINACGLNYAAVEVLSFLTLTWMCICVYTSLFKVRFFNLYLLIPHHHTDPNSLLWFTGYMCKMMAPLCYNYINLIGPTETRNNQDHTETVFSQFMGKADLVPFLGSTFMDWFPVVVLIPAFAAIFHIPSLKWFGDNNDGDLEDGGSLNINVAEGKDLVLEERRLLERSMDHDNGPPLGLLDRAKSIFGIHSTTT
ncbi:LMBR1-like membrane protein-domain-containing protein [Chlamydoabsidia padenii]|nr:LMBR1-like membrane protein-domain-containing protein [Chlamydoabsidia padenii]